MRRRQHISVVDNLYNKQFKPTLQKVNALMDKYIYKHQYYLQHLFNWPILNAHHELGWVSATSPPPKKKPSWLLLQARCSS